MPAPVWDFAPKNQAGGFTQGFDRRPSETPNWSPVPAQAYPFVTEPGGAMLTRNHMKQAGMGDFMTYPQGAGPQDFLTQAVDAGALPGPSIYPEQMDESALFSAPGAPGAVKPGSMAWESGPVPWAKPATNVLAPSAAPGKVSKIETLKAIASEGKAKEAAKAAKIAADNAVRAAVAGAPRIAATNAATAQVAANVAAVVATTPNGQKAAAHAQTEATKAVAAANVAAKNAAPANGAPANGAPANGAPANGVGDFLELSGMGGMGRGNFLSTPLFGGVEIKHVLIGLGVGAAGFFAYRKIKG